MVCGSLCGRAQSMRVRQLQETVKGKEREMTKLKDALVTLKDEMEVR